jgi:hypothetical protein
VRIFISYSSKYRDICERIQLALEADGRHEVFVDRSELQPGKPFDERLREGIDQCDLLLFGSVRKAWRLAVMRSPK